MTCVNLIGSYRIACKPNFVMEGKFCLPCTNAHRSAGKCYDGASCADIKLTKPNSRDGVYLIQPDPVGKIFPIYCRMKSDGGGWGLVYQIAGASDMMTTDAHRPGLLVGAESGPKTTHSAKFDDKTIRLLCGDQYNVRQYQSSTNTGPAKGKPHSLFCRFTGDIESYGDNLQNTGKACSNMYDSSGSSYRELKWSKAWSRGFSTWGNMPGATITQLHYVDKRLGSHVCNQCTAKQPGCNGGGRCHTQVFCKATSPGQCGNGKRDDEEQCDDGNQLSGMSSLFLLSIRRTLALLYCCSGDGCNNECLLEKGFTCHKFDNRADFCEDHNECSNPDICPDKNSRCVNLNGTYMCECHTGFVDAHIVASACPPITDNAKLSDTQINKIAGRKKIFKLVSHYRHAKYYMRSDGEFDDTKKAMNLLPVEFSVDRKNWKASCRGRLDTECGFGNNCKRIFTDYSGVPGCYPSRGKRCFNDGSSCGHKPIVELEMWVKARSGQAGKGTCGFIRKKGIFTIQIPGLAPFLARCDEEGFTKILQIHSSAYKPTRSAFNAAAITQLVGCKAALASAAKESACADGTDEHRWLKRGVAACTGDFKGPIEGSEAKAICNTKQGWNVCTGVDMVKSGFSYSEGRSFKGCFVYDAANDCHGCFATCKGTKSVNGRRGCADRLGGHDIAGIGQHCSNPGKGARACVAGGRINGNSHGTGFCTQGKAHGVACCKSKQPSPPPSPSMGKCIPCKGATKDSGVCASGSSCSEIVRHHVAYRSMGQHTLKTYLLN